MVRITCGKCGERISGRAKYCPHCDAPQLALAEESINDRLRSLKKPSPKRIAQKFWSRNQVIGGLLFFAGIILANGFWGPDKPTPPRLPALAVTLIGLTWYGVASIAVWRLTD